MSSSQTNVAVLIDGENVHPALIPGVLQKMKEFGEIVIKKVYADFSKPHLKIWEPVISRYLLEVHHQFNATVGKNATDIAMTIDAMDMLHRVGDHLDVLCIVSSDSDFSHLAQRFRRSGVKVIGIGRADSALKGSCDLFFAFPQETLPASAPSVQLPTSTLAPPPKTPELDRLRSTYLHADAARHKDKDGWISLSALVNLFQKMHPAHSPLHYKGERQSQMKKVIERLREDHPKAVEMRADRLVLWVRFR
jgi:uncharacterized protein (TIGR00288 family)